MHLNLLYTYITIINDRVLLFMNKNTLQFYLNLFQNSWYKGLKLKAF